MKRMILLILLVALAFTLGCAQAETEKLVVSPTFTMYMCSRYWFPLMNCLKLKSMVW